MTKPILPYIKDSLIILPVIETVCLDWGRLVQQGRQGSCATSVDTYV